MCGIFFHIDNESTFNSSILSQDIKTNLIKRGPDYNNFIQYTFNGWKVLCFSTILHIRGDVACKQPLENDRFTLLWNGEIFDGIDVPKNTSDTQILFDFITQNPNEILNTFSMIQGPWSFVLLDRMLQVIYYGRDRIGRRSLAIKQIKKGNENISVSICSLLPDSSWNEVNVGVMNIINFSMEENNQELNSISSQPLLSNFPLSLNKETVYKMEAFDPLLPFNSSSFDFFDSNLNFLLNESVKKRVSNIPNKAISILFSGGLDSSILALLANVHLPQDYIIELVNISFMGEMAADRLSAQYVFDYELTRLAKFRQWKFYKVDISKEEYDHYRSHIIQLMYPNNTVMDISIGAALWFAAKAIKLSKIILSGLGADELFAGYSRHREKYKRGGREGLLSELQLDIDRLPFRNLGRDDRCISDHGLEVRFPFLDENVMKFSLEIPLEVKCNLELPIGIGDKIILRRLAEKMGFAPATVNRVKRAIQFGSKSALYEGRQMDGKQELT